MAKGWGVHVTGLDEVLRLLGVDLTPAFSEATFAISEEVRGVITPYPNQRPPADPTRWYQRGYGPRWLRKRTGTVGGRKTSEQLGQSWASERAGPGRAILGSRASYAPYVQSAEHQAEVHRITGWTTDEQAVNEVLASGVVDRILIDALVARLARA